MISAFSSDGRIAADKLVVLSDPRHAIPNYDAILTIVAAARARRAAVAALKPLIGRVRSRRCARPITWSTATPGRLSPDAAARWLEKKIGL